jgi:hypothetical protein
MLYVWSLETYEEVWYVQLNLDFWHNACSTISKNQGDEVKNY